MWLTLNYITHDKGIQCDFCDPKTSNFTNVRSSNHLNKWVLSKQEDINLKRKAELNVLLM